MLLGNGPCCSEDDHHHLCHIHRHRCFQSFRCRHDVLHEHPEHHVAQHIRKLLRNSSDMCWLGASSSSSVVKTSTTTTCKLQSPGHKRSVSLSDGFNCHGDEIRRRLHRQAHTYIETYGSERGLLCKSCFLDRPFSPLQKPTVGQ